MTPDFLECPANYLELEELDLSWRGLVELPAWVKLCVNLKKIICSHNYIKVCDETNLPPNINYLDCSYN